MHTQASTEDDQQANSNPQKLHNPTWKIKEQRLKFRKKVFGSHYNYNYRKPIKANMFHAQEVKNTEIERENRILLEKIQSIFKGSRKKRNNLPQTEPAEEKDPHPISMQSVQHLNCKNLELDRLRNWSPGARKPKELSLEQRYPKTNKQSNLKDREEQLIRRKLENHSDISSVKRYRQFSHQCRKAVANEKDYNLYDRQLNSNKLPDKLNKRGDQSPQLDVDKLLSLKSQATKNNHINQQTSDIVLFHGLKTISGKSFKWRIIVTKNNHSKDQSSASGIDPTPVYRIEAQQTGKDRTRRIEKIEMPYEQYQLIYYQQLTQDHQKIFEYLWINKNSQLIQFVGINRKTMEAVQYSIQQCPPSEDELSSKNQQQQKIQSISDYSQNGNVKLPCDNSKDRAVKVTCERQGPSMKLSHKKPENDEKNSSLKNPQEKESASNISLKEELSCKVNGD